MFTNISAAGLGFLFSAMNLVSTGALLYSTNNGWDEMSTVKALLRSLVISSPTLAHSLRAFRIQLAKLRSPN